MNEKELINILIASDINYAPYYGVMLTSLFQNNSDVPFNIHLLTDRSWSQAMTEKFDNLTRKFNSTFHVYWVDEQVLADFPIKAHITLPTYYNLCASALLPDSIHRIIYMDGDMIVNGDIRPLWNLDLQGNACAQVTGAAYYDEEQYERLGYDKKYGVYNNGIVVYDFDQLRQMDYSHKAIQFIIDNPEKVTWMDQDAMNALLHDKTLRLPYRYNFQTLALTKERWQHYDDDFRNQVWSESRNPVVVHYTGHLKPWQMQYYGLPFGSLWDKYCRQSDWKDAKQHRPLSRYAKHLIKRLVLNSSFRKKCEELYIAQAWALR